MIALLAAIQDEGPGISWANQQNIHPLALVMIVCLGFAMLVVRRRWAVGPFIIVMGFITVGQRFVVAGLDFPMLRVLVFVGWLRIIMRNELLGFRFRTLDVLFLAWGASQVVTQAALTASQYPAGLGSILIYRCGWLVDNLGAYFLFRVLVRGWEDLEAALKLLAALAIPIALLFLLEKATGRNLFSVFGGVREITWIREGKLRCQGPFSHPILAGCFWAGIAPLFAALAWSARAWKVRSILAIVCALTVVICCASSTPLMGVFAAIVGALMFPLRGYLRLIQVGTPIMLVVLHLVMKKPVWHLIARIDLTGGSTGYHRYLLIDNTIRHFKEWWLMGTSNQGAWHSAMLDITNHYLQQAIYGGVSTLVLFLAMVFVAFRGVGRILRLSTSDRRRYMMAWLVGVSLFAHCAMMMAVSYFQKPLLLWNLTLATIASLEVVTVTVARRGAIATLRREEEGLPASLEPQSS